MQLAINLGTAAVLYANTYHHHYIFVVSKRSLVVSVLDTLAHKTTAYKFALQHIMSRANKKRKIKVHIFSGGIKVSFILA